MSLKLDPAPNDRFIGLILLPLVGNAAEHVTSVWMACKGKMELTIGVAVGSSIQIAAGMIPLLVLIAWPLQKDLTLFFVSLLQRSELISGKLRDHCPVRFCHACESAVTRWYVPNSSAPDTDGRGMQGKPTGWRGECVSPRIFK